MTKISMLLCVCVCVCVVCVCVCVCVVCVCVMGGGGVCMHLAGWVAKMDMLVCLCFIFRLDNFIS